MSGHVMVLAELISHTALLTFACKCTPLWNVALNRGRMIRYRHCEISRPLKLEAAGSSETSVRLCRTEQLCISEDIGRIFVPLPVYNTERYALVNYFRM
jgi:hypothetical protein